MVVGDSRQMLYDYNEDDPASLGAIQYVLPISSWDFKGVPRRPLQTLFLS